MPTPSRPRPGRDEDVERVVAAPARGAEAELPLALRTVEFIGPAALGQLEMELAIAFRHERHLGVQAGHAVGRERVHPRPPPPIHAISCASGVTFSSTRLPSRIAATVTRASRGRSRRPGA